MADHTPRGRLHAIIEGRVQAVGFRAHTVWQARALGLCGWVRNLPGGSVETEAEGPRPALEEFLEFLRRGPRSARVADVRVTWLPYQGDLGGFDVRGW